MTKQEYESSTAIIMTDKKLGQTNRMIELRYIDKEYIASLEAENAKLEAMVEKAIQSLSVKCPPNVKEGTCPHNDNVRCQDCWREWLEGEK